MVRPSRTLKHLGAALRRYRKEQGLSQLDLSSRIHKRQATISNLEAGEGGTLDTLFSVLSALELELVLRPRTKTDASVFEELF